MKKEKHSAMRYFRWTAILLCLIGITACRQDTPRFRIGVAQCSDDSWRHKMNDEILREAMFYDGVSVEIRSAGDDNRRQAEDIHYFMDKGVDLLIISANEAAPMTPIVEEAYRKGIPVITVDRKILSDKYTAYIGADNYEIGRAVGNYIASRLKGKGNIVELTGLSGSTPAMERHQGFMAAISHFPEIKLIDKADAAWERGPAEVEMDSMLRRHSKIDAVYAHNDRIAPGAYQAAKKAGREKEMIFVGIDALPGKGNGLELVLDSVLDATFIYPTNGDKVLQLAMNILEKKSYPRETVMNTAVVDRTNAHIMQLQTTHISELDQKIETLNGRISGYLSRVATQQVIMYGSLLILLLVAGLLLVVYKSLRSKNRLNRELSEQKKQLEEQRDKLEEQRDQLIQLSHQLEEATHAKLVFFTNISHEFRTPLTLILGQIEVLMQMDLGTTIYNRILRIYKNAWHMRNLISELLDFRKQEQGYLKLKVEEQNLVTFTRQIYMCFYEYAQKKEITYRFDNVEETISVWFDSKQLQKVIFNLLSNAFKYTPNKGSIRVEVRMLASQAIVSVCDTGVGIPEEHISKIFERFYQTDNSSSFTLGTGIGLALAKGIMNMHHGKIDVESTVGKGTKFTLSLPLGNRHFSDEEMATVESRESVIISEAVPMLPFEQIMDVEEEKTKVQENIKEEDKPIILLVDDNEELLSMLEDLFLPIYKVYIAHDGREGLEMARQIQPDLIISDVMMPEMSGKELCYKIKTNVELSHISVILLTAQTSVEYVVEGLMFGADDYVTKPFNVKVLIARCNNLIKNKKRLIAHYAGKTITESPVTEAINERDKELLAKCVNIIKENFENPAFDVTALASELCVGRSKLYMQFKQMTGLTPNEFILKIKLDEAMSLLKNHPELNISEISIRLGFSSPRYFSKSFKAFFGVAPQTVRSRKKE